jgi:hypothetical protein
LAHAANEINHPENAMATYTLRHATNEAQGAIGATRFERAEGFNPRTGVDNWTRQTLGAEKNIGAMRPSEQAHKLHPEHQSMLDSHRKMRAEMERPIKVSVMSPKAPPQLGAISRRIAERRSRQTAEDNMAYLRYTSSADFFA